ncbi:MAG: Gfo/Idh/MocA family oxidoreductase [Oscillospiraceae bacterium]|nr:Gfo/Idh/MocA family oxidoreductase [Oscillospiraceae bacterium]
MGKIIYWGMVGTGDVTEKKSGPGFSKAENSTLYAVTNRTYEKAVDYAKRHCIERVYANIDEMIADGNVDAIYIATPPGSHKEYAKKCAQAKIPCYIEKPIALNLRDHIEMMEAFEKTGTKAFAAYYRRAHERFIKVKQLTAGGAIGEVRFVHLSLYRPASNEEITNKSWRIHPEISGGGIFMDVGVHQLDILDFILGPIDEVKAYSKNSGGYYTPEDTINAVFEFKSGIQMSADWCFTAGISRDEIEIVGSKGRITLSCFGTDPIMLETENKTDVFEFRPPDHVHQPLIQTIVDELNGKGKCPSTLETALNTAKICEKIYSNY